MPYWETQVGNSNSKKEGLKSYFSSTIVTWYLHGKKMITANYCLFFIIKLPCFSTSRKLCMSNKSSAIYNVQQSWLWTKAFWAVLINTMWCVHCHVCMLCVQKEGFREITWGSLGEHSRYPRALVNWLWIMLVMFSETLLLILSAALIFSYVGCSPELRSQILEGSLGRRHL